QVLLRVAEPAGFVADQRGRLLDDGVGGNHLPGHLVVADAEMLQGTLRLRPPELVGRYVDRTEAVVLDTSCTHGCSLHARSRCGCTRSAAIPRVTLKTFACPPLTKRGEWTFPRVVTAGRNTRRGRGRSPR